MKTMPFILGLFLVVNSATASTDSIILNGSFELPTIPENSFQIDTPASWNISGNCCFIFNGNGNVSGWPSPRDGQQYVDIGNAPSGSVSFFQNFTIANGGTYELTWSDSAHVDAPGSLYSVNIIDNSSQTVASQNLDASHGGNWQDRSLLVNLVAGSYTLTFNNEPGPVYDTVLDNVALTAVPVPAAFWLFGSSLAGLGFLRKGRRS